MSCNGCRVLRKGCSDACILRPCLQWIDSAEAQGRATIFVAKFFGRAGLTSFLLSVPENMRPAIFRSLLVEAAGRRVNPVGGAVGLLWTGNWRFCEAAVERVLQGGELQPISEFLASDSSGVLNSQGPGHRLPKRRRRPREEPAEKLRLGSPSINSEGSQTTTCGDHPAREIKLLNLFN